MGNVGYYFSISFGLQGNFRYSKRFTDRKRTIESTKSIKMRKARITVAKNKNGKGYCVNKGGKKVSAHRTKKTATEAAEALRKKRSK